MAAARVSEGATDPSPTPKIPGLAGLAFFPPWFGNPYVRLLYHHLAQLGFSVVADGRFTLGWLRGARHTVEILHFNWPQQYYIYRGRPRRLAKALSWSTLARFTGRLIAARLFGYRIVWTVHQLYPHESGGKRLDRWAAWVLAHLSHALVAHDVATAEAIGRELGSKAARKARVIIHGSYVGVYPRGRPRSEARSELGIPRDAFAFICFGNLRRYKDIGLLLEAFSRASLEDAVLLVAGKARDAETADLVRSAAASDPRIRVYNDLQFVPDEDVDELFAACDVAIVSRGDGGTSGALMLALSLAKPAIVADQPAYVELIAGHGCGWTFEPQDASSLAAAMESAAADPSLAREKGAAAFRLAETFRWPDAAQQFAEVMVGQPLVLGEARPGLP